VPYQYVFGLAHRNYSSKRPRISVRAAAWKFDGKPKLEVCLDCIIDKYGKAGSDGSELLVTPVIGYRTWDIRNNQLVSWYNGDFPWLPDKTEATCTKDHDIPARRCSCGLYALDHVDLRQYTADVYGQVELWGRFKGEDGKAFRAQFGRPTALLCFDWTKADKVHRVAKLYRVPVTHSVKLLAETDWGALADLEGGDPDGHWQGESRGRSDAEEARGAAGGTSRRAACREAAAGAGTLQELIHLKKEGMISFSNVEEVFEE
jgi:hypothetical protein